MRLEELTTVQMRPVAEGQVQVIESKATLNLDAICLLMPATVPSDIAAADGTPVGTPACAVLFPGGQVTVRKTYQEMQALCRGIKLVEED